MRRNSLELKGGYEMLYRSELFGAVKDIITATDLVCADSDMPAELRQLADDLRDAITAIEGACAKADARADALESQQGAGGKSLTPLSRKDAADSLESYEEQLAIIDEMMPLAAQLSNGDGGYYGGCGYIFNQLESTRAEIEKRVLALQGAEDEPLEPDELKADGGEAFDVSTAGLAVIEAKLADARRTIERRLAALETEPAE